jgi:hypothetical protein
MPSTVESPPGVRFSALTWGSLANFRFRYSAGAAAADAAADAAAAPGPVPAHVAAPAAAVIDVHILLVKLI